MIDKENVLRIYLTSINLTYILACLFLPYFNSLFNEPILRGLFEHNLFKLAFYLARSYLLLHSMKVNIKKIPPVLTRRGFDDDERTVDIASTVYILAYFLTKVKFICSYFHCKNVINSSIFMLSLLSSKYLIGLCSCAT